ncbi:hypothetical protein VTK26DRAFT_6289 [Humicola hyalothermophila]
MFASRLVLPAAWLLFIATALAAPASDKLVAGEPWVTVDEDGHPKTVTPVLTTIHGTPTVINAAPHDVTATVSMGHQAGEMVTSTGNAAPRPTNKNGAGAFAVCHNTDGEHKPFCLPKNNDVYHPDSTHYITWDPEYFDPANATVRILGFYATNTNTNASSKNPELEEPISPEEEEEAFSSDTFPATWGFYQWRVEKSILSSKKLQSANITIRMVALLRESDRAVWLDGPTVTVAAKKKAGGPPRKTREHDSDALYIALPLVLTTALLILVCVSVWNRGTRRIDIGELMRASSAASSSSRRRTFGLGGGRGRKGGSGGGGGRGKGEADEAIRLMGRDGDLSSDEEQHHGLWGRHDVAGKKRID